MRPAVEYFAKATLLNFDSPESNIPLAPDVNIRRMNDEESELWLKEIRAMQRGPFSGDEPDPALSNFLLVIRLRSVKRELPSEDFAERAHQVLSALRLFERGDVGMSSLSWALPSTRKRSSGVQFVHMARLKTRPYGAPFQLSSERSGTLIRFFEVVERYLSNKELEVHRNTDVALSRFHYGHTRTRPEDRLVDFIVGFEALLLSREGAKAHRLSERGGLLLGRSEQDRLGVAEELGVAYKARNDIVHDGIARETVQLQETEIGLPSLVDRLERHLARALKAVIVLEQKCGLARADLIRELDKSLLSTEARTKLSQRIEECQDLVWTEY